ncbi:MAG: hypothetical protein HY286_03425 [Planctomycetes bacterium]|nr:hypothetical protein [Planctomycetota bacterium]
MELPSNFRIVNKTIRGARKNEDGYALILSIVVLVALLAIATPFLLTTRMSSRSSVARTGDVRARIEADAATAALMRRLEDTEPELDATPYYDTEDEVKKTLSTPPELYSMRNFENVIVSASAELEQNRIDVNAASPYALAIAFGHAFLAEDLKKDAAEISVDNADAFPEKNGCLWIRGELIQYQLKKGGKFTDCTRQLMSGSAGPYEASVDYRSGTPVIDARAHAVAKHRIRAVPGEFHPYISIEELARVRMDPPNCPPIVAEDIRKVKDKLTVFGEHFGHEEWSVARRITTPLIADGANRSFQCDSGRYLGVGTTVKITTPEGVDYGLVVANGNKGVVLEEPFTKNAIAFGATVQFLVPSPVHINSVSAELLEELLTGLDIERAGTPEPLDREVARKVAAKIKEKPVRGWQDLVENVLVPLLKDTTIKTQHLDAIFRNAEHSCDRGLKYSTVPFSFSGGSRYRIHTGVSINAKSGAERGRAEIESVAEVHAQARDKNDVGLRAVARQVEFDELFRLNRRAAGWMTYPYNSSLFDGSTNPPSRLKAYINALQQLGDSFPFIQSDDPAKSWAQLSPSRNAFPDPLSLHFDTDLTLEGHDVRTLGPWRGSAIAAPSAFALKDPNYVFPGSISGWVRWDTNNVTGTIFDMGGATSAVRDRISLMIEKGDLVARIRDTGGEDTNDAQNVAGAARNEIRYPASNLKPNFWYHFALAFKGSGPTDFALFVDGVPRGKRTLATRLTGDLPTLAQIPDYSEIPVESTDHFPGYGVLKIGAELVEYTGKSGKGFTTARPTGDVPASYTGGRGARGTSYINSNLSYMTEHKGGDTVEFYGYACKLMHDVFQGGGQLKAPLGKFSAAHVSRFQSGPWFTDLIVAPPAGGVPFRIGKGVESSIAIPTLKLQPLDVMEPNTGGGSPSSCDTEFIKGFSTAGGYAVMFQLQGPGGGLVTVKKSPMFGAEVIHYGGVSGTDTLTNVTREQQPTKYFANHGFVFDWQTDIPQKHQNNAYQLWTFVVPCSIGTSGGNYETPTPTDPVMAAQLIELGASGVGLDSTTEWFNYDTIYNGELCRFDGNRWDAARLVTAGQPQIAPNPVPPYNPPFVVTFANLTIPSPPPGCDTYLVSPFKMGDPPPKGIAILAKTIAGNEMTPNATTGQGLNFRGTHNTYSRDHFNSTEVIPCFRTYYGSVFAGRPGRGDRFRYMFPQDVTFAIFDLYLTANWTDPYTQNILWIAPKERIPGPVPIGQTSVTFSEMLPPGGVLQFEDSRNFWRIVKTPSGELPSTASTVSVGGRFDGPGDEVTGTIDEVEFTTPFANFGQISLAKFIVDQPFNATAKTFLLNPVVLTVPGNPSSNPVASAVALPAGAKTIAGQAAGTLPKDAGIFMIGDELIGYDSFDGASGTVTVAANGRGLLGTKPSSHGSHETAVYLDHLVVTQLAGGVTPGVSRIPFEDATGFSGDGTLLIGSELIHYTRQDGGAFSMPEFNDDAEATVFDPNSTSVSLKQKGNGIFRGRYGSVPAAHSSGEIIFRFPYRYWDRWVLGADEPELHYIQMDERMESAFYRRVYWEEELPLAGVSLECLARLDARSPWTAQANKSDGLWLFTTPKDDKNPTAIGRLGERLELRFGVRYGIGSFSPIDAPIENVTVRNDAWKSTPKLRAIASERFGATKILKKEETR